MFTGHTWYLVLTTVPRVGDPLDTMVLDIAHQSRRVVSTFVLAKKQMIQQYPYIE